MGNNDEINYQSRCLDAQEEGYKNIMVSEEDYRTSIELLFSKASGDNPQSYLCAQVLFSLYNGKQWSIKLAQFCDLDMDIFCAVTTAIRGRVCLMKEPHLIVDNGAYRLKRLERKWILKSAKTETI